jgi:hypothetical protein
MIVDIPSMGWNPKNLGWKGTNPEWYSIIISKAWIKPEPSMTSMDATERGEDHRSTQFGPISSDDANGA